MSTNTPHAPSKTTENRIIHIAYVTTYQQSPPGNNSNKWHLPPLEQLSSCNFHYFHLHFFPKSESHTYQMPTNSDVAHKIVVDFLKISFLPGSWFLAEKKNACQRCFKIRHYHTITSPSDGRPNPCSALNSFTVLCYS